MFLTAQGEGADIGRVAVFVRFAGCNLWSGRERDRATAACRFCDTEFVGETRYLDAEALADAVLALWPANHLGHRMVASRTPLLQVDAPLLAALRSRLFYTAVETNGTQPLPVHVDWLCVSPKAGTTLVLGCADELKLVYPQPGAEPERFASFSALHRWFVADGRAAPDQAQHGKGCSLLSRASRMAVGYPGARDMEDAVTATRYRPPPHPLSKPN